MKMMSFNYTNSLQFEHGDRASHKLLSMGAEHLCIVNIITLGCLLSTPIRSPWFSRSKYPYSYCEQVKLKVTVEEKLLMTINVICLYPPKNACVCEWCQCSECRLILFIDVGLRWTRSCLAGDHSSCHACRRPARTIRTPLCHVSLL